MNLGLFELVTLATSAAALISGAWAVVTRRRSAVALALNAVMAVCYSYFAIRGLRSGASLAVLLVAAAGMHAAVASAIMRRAERRAPAA
jgi:CHASE2 domain-containing sensor protein